MATNRSKLEPPLRRDEATKLPCFVGGQCCTDVCRSVASFEMANLRTGAEAIRRHERATQ